MLALIILFVENMFSINQFYLFFLSCKNKIDTALSITLFNAATPSCPFTLDQ